MDALAEYFQSRISAAQGEMQIRRDLPYITDQDQIGRHSVNHFTLRHLVLLEHAGSPYLVGGLSKIPLPDLAAHTLLFLWAVSPDWEPNIAARNKWEQQWIDGEQVEGELVSLVAEIREFIKRSFADRPIGGPAKDAPSASMAAWYVTYFARKFSWSESQILNCPISRLFQYRSANVMMDDPTAVANAPEVNELIRERRQRRRQLLQLDEYRCSRN